MTVYDPLRHREVPKSPEELVRQWFILQLRDRFSVPEHMMMSEVGFNFGKKKYRADIIVYDRDCRPLAVVECKRPEVVIDDTVVQQALRYNAVLDVHYIMLTNGNNTYLYKRNGNGFEPVSRIPDYETMLCRL